MDCQHLDQVIEDCIGRGDPTTVLAEPIDGSSLLVDSFTRVGNQTFVPFQVLFGILRHLALTPQAASGAPP